MELDLGLIANQVVWGVMVGISYTLLAMAFSLIFATSNTINFAIGEFAMLTAYLCYTALERLPVGFVGAALYGIANGSFLAVDWALMTDSIPKASSGRYMGLSNVATATSGIFALALGGVIMDTVGGVARAGSGPRAALVVSIVAYLVAAVLLAPVVEPLRGRRAAGPADPAGEPVGDAPLAGDVSRP
jgi:branched-subunit amino acid ABC-type transport system permease component